MIDYRKGRLMKIFFKKKKKKKNINLKKCNKFINEIFRLKKIIFK
jgi:hypothetical protein